MPRVLITGAAGFIGMHASIRFLKEGWDVVGLDNINNYYSTKLKRDRLKNIEYCAAEVDQHFQFFEADLNSNVWSKLHRMKFEVVLHLAAQAGVRYSLENPEAYLESNILGFQKVLSFVQKSKITRFLYASSSSVYGKISSQPFIETADCNDPESYYAATKKANEMMAKAYFHTHNLKSIGLRFFTVYGPWGRPDMAPMLFAKSAFANDEIKVFNYGKQKRDFTYIDDIVEGILRLAYLNRFPNKALVCNIGNGQPVELLEFIQIIEQETAKTLTKKFTEPQKGDVEITYSDTNLLKELTGYSPKINLKKGIGLFIDWYKTYYEITPEN